MMKFPEHYLIWPSCINTMIPMMFPPVVWQYSWLWYRLWYNALSSLWLPKTPLSALLLCPSSKPLKTFLHFEVIEATSV
jgi:hypothetical protein